MKTERSKNMNAKQAAACLALFQSLSHLNLLKSTVNIHIYDIENMQSGNKLILRMKKS